MDENKEKLGETPIRINDVNNDIDWYQGIQARDNMFVDSPLFTRNMSTIFLFFLFCKELDLFQ